jgi:dephospho-CoA kinase
MIVLGVTGSIGMGKTAAAAALRRLGIPVFEADAEVHRLLAKGGAAVTRIGEAFPGAVRNGAVDRAKLGGIVFADDGARIRLESVVHPLVRAAEMRFLERSRARHMRIVALDIPLLFETGADSLCDASIVVSAPPFVQRGRVLARPGMTPERLAQVLERQMPDPEKRQRADFTVPTGLGFRTTLKALRRIVKLARKKPRRAAMRRAAAITERYARNRPRYRNHGA